MSALTQFGSLADFRSGGVQVIDDDPKNYVFSNIFDVANRSEPYERVAVGKNFEYVIECVRAEGTSAWYACAHDEFALCMDGAIKIEIMQLGDGQKPDAESNGARKLGGAPQGKKMGWVLLKRGHMGLLAAKAAYRFVAERPSCMIIQSILGNETIEKWAKICQTRSI